MHPVLVALKTLGMIFMNKYLLIAFIFFVKSCSQIGYFQDYEESAKLLIGYDSISITREEFDKRKYSFAKVNIGRSQGIIMSLINFNSKKQLSTWYSNDSSYIVTDKIGRIVEIKGLDYSVKVREGSLDNKVESLIVDFPSEESFGLKVNQISKKNNHNKNFYYLGGKIDTNVVIRRMYVNDLKWDYTVKSRFYQGQLIESRQKVHPYLPEIKIEFYFK